MGVVEKVLILLVIFAGVFSSSSSDKDVNNSLLEKNASSSLPVSKENIGVVPVALDDLLEIWEPRLLVHRWSAWLTALRDSSLPIMGASPDDPRWRKCSSEDAVFLDALHKGISWAVILSDASGRAPKGILWGNRYWIGSRELCDDLDLTVLSSSSQNKTPPFRVKFSVVRLNVEINSTKYNWSSQPILGLCLPFSCDVPSVQRLLRRSISSLSTKSRFVEVKEIRQLGGDYELFEDPVFVGLLFTIGVAVVFVMSATIYDFAQISDDESLWGRIILAFSARTNVAKLFSQSVEDESIAALHGIRFLSLLWVMLAHVSLISYHLADNQRFRERVEEHLLFQILSSGGLSVDTFFFISGFLVSFLYFRSSIKSPDEGLFSGVPSGQSTFRKGIRHFTGLMVYRLVRLTPSYLAMIAVVTASMRWLRANVVADLPFAEADTCPRFWWRNVLYINTFFSNNERCMAWSWYLANDTQLYLVGALLLVLASSNFWLSTGFIFIVLGSSWLTTFAVAFVTNHVTSYKEPFAHYDQLYDKPWIRAGPYLIGVITGWLVWRAKPWLSGLSLMALITGWTITAVVMSACMFGLYSAPLESSISAAHAALSHTAWGLTIAWVLVTCAAGRGGTVNAFLAWRPFYPLSRLCYCAYLVHPQLMRVVLLLVDSSIHMSRGLIAVQFIGFTVISFAAALLLSLLFEAPFVALFRIVQPRPCVSQNTSDKDVDSSRECKPGVPTSWSISDFPY